MSTPRQQPRLHSRTPSKSSLRRTSGAQNSSQRSLQPQPSPRFEDNATTEVRYSPRSPPNQTLDYDSNDEDDEEAEAEALIKRDFDSQEPFQHHEGSCFPTASAHELAHPFEPLFTLVEDNVTSEHHHPSIYYIFANDDHEIITEAAVRSLEEDDLGTSSASASAHTQGQEGGAESPEEGRLPPPQQNVKEHYLILDIQPSDEAQPIQSEVQSQVRTSSQGQIEDSLQQQPNFQSQSNVQTAPFVVSSFSSLSPDWQIQSATITAAPTMSEATSGEDEGYMLRIKGRGFVGTGSSQVLASRGRNTGPAKPVVPEASESATTKKRDQETLEEMIDRFQNNLNDIRKLIETDLPMAVAGLDLDPGDVADNDDSADPRQSFDFEAQD